MMSISRSTASFRCSIRLRSVGMDLVGNNTSLWCLNNVCLILRSDQVSHQTQTRQCFSDLLLSRLPSVTFLLHSDVQFELQQVILFTWLNALSFWSGYWVDFIYILYTTTAPHTPDSLAAGCFQQPEASPPSDSQLSAGVQQQLWATEQFSWGSLVSPHLSLSVSFTNLHKSFTLGHR